MTDEVDPRLVALGLVPAPAATPASPSNDWETAAPPKPSDWVVPAPPAAAPPSPPPPSPTPSVVMPGHKPLTVGDLFPGMGKFTGSAPANPPPAPPPPPDRHGLPRAEATDHPRAARLPHRWKGTHRRRLDRRAGDQAATWAGRRPHEGKAGRVRHSGRRGR